MEFEGRSRIPSRLDMTPLIDVVFLLLVFFLLTSTYLVPEAIDLQLPASSTAERAAPAPLVVVLDADRQVTIEGRPVARERVASVLRDLLVADPERRVTLESDAGASVQALLHVVDAIREAGGRSLLLATRDGPDER